MDQNDGLQRHLPPGFLSSKKKKWDANCPEIIRKKSKYQKSGTCRNSTLGNKNNEGVRDYYDFKSAKHPDGNKNIGYMFRSLDKTTKPREKPLKEKKQPFAATI
ncbi:hypothetical protein C2G38_2185627 [Gigaspora rosea]|uniref:Uncharacterized protein n=1 Tax=Gigaspora rosea TaxID=44941 RepID=A0A397VFH0_9GLOM|nr:hypothetical protein C2G38_2185627 [Gigaspora rosea]